MSKRDYDLMTELMIDLMKFPTNLVEPAQRMGTVVNEKMKGIDKRFVDSKDEIREVYKNMKEEFSKFDFCYIKTDIISKDNTIIIKAEMPGFKKEDISLNVEKDALILYAERKEEVEKESDTIYMYKEISEGKFKKAFSLKGLNKDSIKAKYEDGILTIEIEKEEKKEEDIKKINIT